MSRKSILTLSAGFAALCLSAAAMAQEASVPQASARPEADAPADAQAVSPAANATVVAALPPAGQQPVLSAMEKELSEHLAYLQPNVNIDTMPSLFFSVWEHDLVMDARRGLTTRGPGGDDGVDPALAVAPRDISLGGIVYVDNKDWTIWINSVRVSPDAIPDEVMDLKVFKNYVELEWFDKQTNQVFPIRLRAHQRFNLDTRMFLPG